MLSLSHWDSVNPAPSFSEEQLHTLLLDPPNLDYWIRVHRHGISFYFQQDQFQDLSEQYRSGQKELVQIYAEIADLAGRSLNPVERTVTRYWTDYGFQWYCPYDAPEKNVSPAVQEAIIRLAHGLLKRGMKNMYATLLLPE
jgi:hypothetical protein